ncbi:polyketide synthase PksE [Alternaria alternata]|nr:polyketide synthase PksE [Alternaria alternata]
MPPEIDWTSRIFRTSGVRLATSACKKAMQEAQLGPRDITHTVAVTCTDQNNPGYDHFVCQELGLRSSVQRSLLHGVGCAGGLSALRTAADIAAAASLRGRPARILVMACPALFSDGAAALVVCNYLALEEKQTPVFELLEWGSMVVPDTSGHMSYVIKKNAGMIATISKFVPEVAIKSIIPMFRHLRAAIDITHKAASLVRSQASSFDWAIHPGGASILQGAKQALCLTDDHIRASLDVYQHHGNSSSPTVLIVLDKLRMMGEGRENVAATSFGPGLIIEMCIMRRCRHIAVPRPFKVDKHTSCKLHVEQTEAPPAVQGNDDVTEAGERLATPPSASFKNKLKRYQYTETRTVQDNPPLSASPTKSRKRGRTTATAAVKSSPESSARPKKKRMPSRYADPSKYAHLSPLVDILQPNLICVFVGTNPGVQTATAGHAYAHPSNLFWKLLHCSGLTDRRLKPEEDRSLPDLYCMGNTNIVERPSKDAAELSKEETAAGTANLDAKFLKYKPEAVCIVGKGIWEAIWRYRYDKNLGKKDFKYGWQDEEHNMGKSRDDKEERDTNGNVWKGSRVFVTTSTSGLAASLKPAEKEAIWKPFGEWVQKRRAERNFVPRPLEAQEASDETLET